MYGSNKPIDTGPTDKDLKQEAADKQGTVKLRKRNRFNRRRYSAAAAASLMMSHVCFPSQP